MIDIHTHLGKIMLDKKPLKPYQLLQMMDREGIKDEIGAYPKGEIKKRGVKWIRVLKLSLMLRSI